MDTGLRRHDGGGFFDFMSACAAYFIFTMHGNNLLRTIGHFMGQQ